ncbi:MAG: hypothetical protein GY861_15680 [bacterium]|nr:hypothetical protein [bacterium]
MEEKQAVNQDSAPEEQKDVYGETIQPQEEVAEQQEVQTPSDEGQTSVQLDDVGVPWKNRAYEANRKLEQTNSQLEELTSVVKKLQETQSSQTRKYSEGELLAFANAEDTSPANRQWAMQEIDKVRTETVSNTVKKQMDAFKQNQSAETQKQQSLTAVQQRYPDAFQKNANGQIVGWDNNSPLTQRIAEYMRDPEIAKNPRGLWAAASMAFSDLQLGQSAKTQANQKQLKQQVKTLQKKTLVEGTGQPVVQPVSTRKKAIDATVSGKVKDGHNAMKEILRSRGVIE